MQQHPYAAPIDDEAVSKKQKGSFIECDICHYVCKNIKEIGAHKRDVHSAVYRPKSRQLVSQSSTPSVTPNKATKHPTVNPQSSSTQVSCHLCKMVIVEGSSVFRHISAEHPQYKFFCDYETCYRSFITISSLYKHKRQVHAKEQKNIPESEDFTVGCGQEFKYEDACDEHDCPTCQKAKVASLKREPKVEPQEGNISTGNKRSTHSSKTKK